MLVMNIVCVIQSYSTSFVTSVYHLSLTELTAIAEVRAILLSFSTIVVIFFLKPKLEEAQPIFFYRFLYIHIFSGIVPTQRERKRGR